MTARRRGPPRSRPARPREDERQQLAARWEENRKRREAGWPVGPDDVELVQKAAVSITRIFDDGGNQVAIERRGADALAEFQKADKRSAKLRAKVQTWNRKSGKDGKVRDVKDISGEDVMEILEIASALTNDPAYAAACKALILHRLNKGGLRRAFAKLRQRHGHDHVPSLYGPVNDTVQEYMDEYGYEKLRAIEHIVADVGLPGTSFADAVDKARKAYANRHVLEAERQRYLAELADMAAK